MKRIVSTISISVAAIILILVPTGAFGAVYIAHQSYTLGTDDIAEGNVYAGTTTVTVNGRVTGDFIAAASTITLAGTLEDDVIVAGGTVTVSGTIQDDLRVAGGTVLISGTVEGDVNVAGGNVTLTQNAAVSGDVTVASGEFTHEGSIQGNLGVAAGTIHLKGIVEKNVDARVDSLEVTSSAIITGNLYYKGKNEATISSDATILGETIYTQQKTEKFGRYFGAIGLTITAFLVNLIGTLIIALLLVLYVKNLSKKIGEYAEHNFAKTLLTGLLILIVSPVLGILLFVTILGIPLASMVFIVYALLIFLGAIYGSLIAGAYTLKLFQKTKSIHITWQSAVLGVILLQAVMLVPIIGWLIAGIFFLVGIGAASITLFQLMRK